MGNVTVLDTPSDWTSQYSGSWGFRNSKRKVDHAATRASAKDMLEQEFYR
jgi:hypothetical protein